MSNDTRDPASFRDPSGYVFWHEGQVYRAVSPPYAEDYDALVSSGLLDDLWGKGLLIPHVEEARSPRFYLSLATNGPLHRGLSPEPQRRCCLLQCCNTT